MYRIRNGPLSRSWDDLASTARSDPGPLVQIRGLEWPAPGDWWMTFDRYRIAVVVLETAPEDIEEVGARFRRFDPALSCRSWTIVLPPSAKRSMYSSALSRMHKIVSPNHEHFWLPDWVPGKRLEGWSIVPQVYHPLRDRRVLEEYRRRIGPYEFVPA